MNTAVDIYGRAILFRGHSYLDSYIDVLDRARQLQVHRASSARRQDSAEDHRSPPQGVLRARGDPAEGRNRAVSDQTVLPPI